MNTIVLNTATGAVTEYDWTFQSVSQQRAGSAAGLFTLGGDTDDGAAITAELRGGTPSGETVQSVGNVFVAATGEGAGVLIVQGASASWEYPLQHRASSIAKATPGRGINERCVGFGYRNVAGAAFRIDRIDAEVIPSTNRRK